MTLEGSEAECQDCRVRELPKALVGLSCGADSLPLQGLSLNCSEMVDTQGSDCGWIPPWREWKTEDK